MVFVQLKQVFFCERVEYVWIHVIDRTEDHHRETAMIKMWKDKDWLLCNEGNRTKQVVINGIPVRCYCIKQSVIEKELKLSPDECSDKDNRF